MKFKDKYSYIGNVIYEPKSELPSLTDESFKDECDIEFIISNFVQRGIEPPEHQVQYGKQISSDDFAHSMQVVAECKSVFECLSSVDKERFGNDVSNFLDFVSKPENLKESYEKGYIDPQSVDLSDVYPDRFKGRDILKETSSPAGDITGQSVVNTAKGDDVLAEKASPENPTQS